MRTDTLAWAVVVRKTRKSVRRRNFVSDFIIDELNRFTTGIARQGQKLQKIFRLFERQTSNPNIPQEFFLCDYDSGQEKGRGRLQRKSVSAEEAGLTGCWQFIAL